MTTTNGELVVHQEPIAASPLDMPVAMFRDGLDRRGQNRKALMGWIREALSEGTDFGSIKIGGRQSKPSLLKPGAEKICGMLGVTVTFPTLYEYERAALSGAPIEHILLRCEILDGSNRVVATGAGARSIAKDQGDLNKALKMAQKSAHIDATLRLAGLSELFTQDIEDMKLEPPKAPELSQTQMAHRLELVETLSDSARTGKEAFGKAWKGLPQADRELVGKEEFGRLKGLISDDA